MYQFLARLLNWVRRKGGGALAGCHLHCSFLDGADNVSSCFKSLPPFLPHNGGLDVEIVSQVKYVNLFSCFWQGRHFILATGSRAKPFLYSFWNICTCGACVCVRESAHVCTGMFPPVHRGQMRMLDVLLNHSLSYLLETGFIAEPSVHGSAQSSWPASSQIHLSPRSQHGTLPGFYMHGGNPNLGLHTCTQVLLPIDHLPSHLTLE